MRVEYHESAREELLNEIAFLELRAKGLGKRFHMEVKKIERIIKQFPEAGRELRPGVRSLAIQKFPYSIVYASDRRNLSVIAVAHQKRRPGYWLNRITKRG